MRERDAPSPERRERDDLLPSVARIDLSGDKPDLFERCQHAADRGATYAKGAPQRFLARAVSGPHLQGVQHVEPRRGEAHPPENVARDPQRAVVSAFQPKEDRVHVAAMSTDHAGAAHLHSSRPGPALPLHAAAPTPETT